MGDEAPLFVRFDLSDGTAVQRAWHVQAEVLAGEGELARQRVQPGLNAVEQG